MKVPTCLIKEWIVKPKYKGSITLKYLVEEKYPKKLNSKREIYANLTSQNITANAEYTKYNPFARSRTQNV